jgi:dolichol-phosphate mannosyltransferase
MTTTKQSAQVSLSPTLSVVAPAYNEQECLEQFVEQTDAVLRDLGETYELIVVNDGSSDDTLKVARALNRRYDRLAVVNLSRNFGHEMASSAGLEVARGQAVVLIDADLQDPPTLIPEMVQRWREGYDVVYAQRRTRSGETIFKKTTSWLFYRLFQKVTGLHMPKDTGDFRLMDRKVVSALRTMPERRRLVRGMVAWAGYRQTAVAFDRHTRYGGETKYNVVKLVQLAIDSAMAYTTAPLRLAYPLGGVMLACALLGLGWLLTGWLFPGLAPDAAGTSAPTVLLASLGMFLGGAHAFLLGVLGEYVGRIYEQVQQRPLYLIEGVYRESDPEAAAVDQPRGGRRTAIALSESSSPRRSAAA